MQSNSDHIDNSDGAVVHNAISSGDLGVDTEPLFLHLFPDPSGIYNCPSVGSQTPTLRSPVYQVNADYGAASSWEPTIALCFSVLGIMLTIAHMKLTRIIFKDIWTQRRTLTS